MKKVLTASVTLLTSLAFSVGMVGATPTPPAQCTGTYTNTIQSSATAGSVKGTAANDFIIVNGDRNSVTGLDGNDCIVLNGTGNSVKGGNGNDVIVDNTGGNSLKGEDGDDYISGQAGSSLNGGNGTDTCVSDLSTTSQTSCEL